MGWDLRQQIARQFPPLQKKRIPKPVAAALENCMLYAVSMQQFLWSSHGVGPAMASYGQLQK